MNRCSNSFGTKPFWPVQTETEVTTLIQPHSVQLGSGANMRVGTK